VGHIRPIVPLISSGSDIVISTVKVKLVFLVFSQHKLVLQILFNGINFQSLVRM